MINGKKCQRYFKKVTSYKVLALDTNGFFSKRCKTLDTTIKLNEVRDKLVYLKYFKQRNRKSN